MRPCLPLGTATRCLGVTPLILIPRMSYAQPLLASRDGMSLGPLRVCAWRYRRSGTSRSRGTPTTRSRSGSRSRTSAAYEALWMATMIAVLSRPRKSAPSSTATAFSPSRSSYWQRAGFGEGAAHDPTLGIAPWLRLCGFLPQILVLRSGVAKVTSSAWLYA